MSAILSRKVPRRLTNLVVDRMAQEPVIVLEGPRTVGKSTLLATLAKRFGVGVVDLDDLATRDAIRADPALFVRSLPGPVLIDEFQHAPAILDAIKAELNADLRPGRFVITGSTRYSTTPTFAQALTGRAHRIAVSPLSQGEIFEQQEDFAKVLMNDPAFLVEPGASQIQRESYVRRALAGGFPLALARSNSHERARWFDDYVQLVIEREVLDITRVRQRRMLPELLRGLAAQSGQILNISRVASDLQMEKSTAENYVKLLEAVFLIQRLPAWGTTLGSRVAAAPKVHLVDSGLAGRLQRLTEEKLLAASAAALAEFGQILETFVTSEIAKQLDWLEEPVVRGHYRTHTGDEVDLVVERSDGKVACVEVKAGSRVPAEALQSMIRLKRRLGSNFLGGATLYTGARSYTYEDRIHIVPIERLWQPIP
ncbi:MAG: ATP-binding protein [Actinomycetota bacterium]